MFDDGFWVDTSMFERTQDHTDMERLNPNRYSGLSSDPFDGFTQVLVSDLILIHYFTLTRVTNEERRRMSHRAEGIFSNLEEKTSRGVQAEATRKGAQAMRKGSGVVSNEDV